MVSRRKPGLFVKMSRLPFSIGSFPFAYAVTPETSNLTEFAVFTLSVIQLKALAFRVFLKLFTFQVSLVSRWKPDESAIAGRLHERAARLAQDDSG